VSAALAGPGSQITRCAGPGTYSFAGDAHCLARPSLRRPRPQWSRPVRIDVCSVFARMSRDAPALLGICSAARMRAAGRSGSSWHVLALFDSSSRRISEQSSGLLIRGFGVRVPGGAPALTWGFWRSRSFLCVRFVPMLAPCSLVSLDLVGAGLSTLARSGPRCSKLAGQLLSQWSRPPLEALSAEISGPLRSVRSAGDAQLPGMASATAAALADCASLDNPGRPAQVQKPASVTVPALSAYPCIDP
jgi:hypothetical protein